MGDQLVQLLVPFAVPRKGVAVISATACAVKNPGDAYVCSQISFHVKFVQFLEQFACNHFSAADKSD